MPRSSGALDFRKPHLIRDEHEYDVIVAEIDRLLDSNPREGSAAEEYLEFLALLVEDYDRKKHELPGDPVTPQSIVLFMLEQRGMTRGDLAQAMGGRARVSQFFSGKRRLSLRQVAALRSVLRIPADLLIDFGVPPGRREVSTRAAGGAGRRKRTGRRPTRG
jgi:HTH-type transcriptional regulator/antitoxin HigA